MENESKYDWTKRCMGDEDMLSEFPDDDQKYAVCMEQWEGSSEEPVEEME